MLARTLEAVRAFRASGRKTLGILHASDELAARYAELLSRDVDVHLLTERTETFEEGVSVASVKLERTLLYVAVTRALHRLTVLHRGRPSRFLAG